MRFGALLFAALVGIAPRAARAEPAPTVVRMAPACQATESAAMPPLDPPPDLSEFAGKAIAAVNVVLEGNVWDDVAVPRVASIKPGESFSPGAARRALDALLGSGGFARGRVTARSEASGVVVSLYLVPRKLVRGLKLDLHESRLDRDELLREADLSEGGEIIGADLSAMKCRIEGYLSMHGYPRAEVAITMRDTDDPARASVLVDVTPGHPRVVDGRYFYVFDASPDQVLPIANGYAVRSGDRADGPALDQADAALAQTLHARGWYRAVVSHDVVENPAAPPGAASAPPFVGLRVRIDSGPLFVARFEGNEHFDTEVLAGVLGIETETDRSPLHLADKLRVFYVKRGFLDVEVRAFGESAAKDLVQVVVFRISEHSRVRVVGRSYPCLKLDAITRLRDGGPRSPAAIGTEVDSYLDEELPGADLFVDPDPNGVSATIGGAGAGQLASGARAVPLDLRPEATYAADTYERAALHVQELYRNEGFLHAEVGPVRAIRARCDPRSPPKQCVPMPLPPMPEYNCGYDRSGLPAADSLAALDPVRSCVPDPLHGVTCAETMQVVIPVRLGPRTSLWDVAFTGVKSASEREVAEAARVPLGDAASTTKLDDARRRIVDWYKEAGYYYVDVKYALEPSADNTRARVRFDVTEGDQVIVRAIVIRGLENTNEDIVRRRVTLSVGRPFGASDVRKTQERIATLGVFSSVTIALSDPYIPQPIKDVVIDVVERPPQYVEVRPGFSTGEGVRGVLEYGHRDLLGYAWALTIHLQASYLPDFLILDPQVAANYGGLPTADRIATRNTVTMSWPEVGLGPNIRAQIDGVYVRDLERDFTLFKVSVLGTLLWRPVREVQVTGGPDYEHNDIHLFSYSTIAAYLMQNPGNSDLDRLLRVPDGDSDVVAGRIAISWDRRDNAFNAHRGTYVAAGVEQVNSYPVRGTAPDASQQFQGHFLRLTQTLAGYLPITNAITFAAELRVGEIANILPCTRPFYPSGTVAAPSYCTYPDRLFFMGGVDSMRGWLQDTFIPQEYADQIAATAKQMVPFTVNQIPLRGGNLMINPRFELRFPVRGPVDGALFGDFGNLWNDPNYVFVHGLTLRADAGAGIRVQTPVGPLVFDYGINVTRRSYEDFGAFHFAIGLF